MLTKKIFFFCFFSISNLAGIKKWFDPKGWVRRAAAEHGRCQSCQAPGKVHWPVRVAIGATLLQCIAKAFALWKAAHLTRHTQKIMQFSGAL